MTTLDGRRWVVRPWYGIDSLHWVRRAVDTAAITTFIDSLENNKGEHVACLHILDCKRDFMQDGVDAGWWQTGTKRVVSLSVALAEMSPAPIEVIFHL